MGATIESEAPPPTCETLVDTFPPAAPKDLKSISGEGAINLIWEPNAREGSRRLHRVARRRAGGKRSSRSPPAPIVEPSFKDNVQPGIAYVYAVRAVDRAGNARRARRHARDVETARLS